MNFTYYFFILPKLTQDRKIFVKSSLQYILLSI